MITATVCLKMSFLVTFSQILSSKFHNVVHFTRTIESQESRKFLPFKVACHQTHVKHGYHLVYKNEEKNEIRIQKVPKFQIDGKNAKVCQFNGDYYNGLSQNVIACYVSNDSEIKILQCFPSYTSHFQITRIKKAGAIHIRDCSLVGKIYPECTSKERDQTEICDYSTDGCNNRQKYNKTCYVGRSENCKGLKSDLSDINFDPKTMECHSNFCHTTRISNNNFSCPPDFKYLCNQSSTWFKST
uniref:Uncharacterized protein n=1 Tax=Panagrolaimus sp. JU765 TaxID=591449 RepID=A0AC34Q426_9BILA